MERKPWLEGSLEVLELAIEQYYMGINSKVERDASRYLRVSLINIDDAAELAIRAFIQYHTGEEAQRNFHKNLTWVCRGGSSHDVNLSKELEGRIRYYHNLRDTLYHQGYSLVIPRLEVFDYIEKVIELFKLLFREDLDVSLQYNNRRRFLIRTVELEKSLLDLSSSNKIEVANSMGISATVQRLADAKLISENTIHTIEEATNLREHLIPRSQPLSEAVDIYEAVLVIEETLTEIKMINNKRKGRSSG